VSRRAGALGFAALLLLARIASAQLTVYADTGWRGESHQFDSEVRDLRRAGWNDRISSLRLESGTWELCREVEFRDCRTVRSNESDLRQWQGWNDAVSSLRPAGGSAGLTVFQDYDYRGASKTFDRDQRDLRSAGWNDKISSLRLGSGAWELCRQIDFRDCQVFRADEPELGKLRGWNDQISSLRRVDSSRALIEVYEHFRFEGAEHTFEGAVEALQREGWNDRISSLRVVSGRWQICRDNGFHDCREVGGDERELPKDWNDRISSLRPLRPFSND
jgi:beta/gamma crystallin